MYKKPPTGSYFSLYRFTTPFENMLNIVGLIFAVAAGVAQPAMSQFLSLLVQSLPTPPQYLRKLMTRN